MVAKLGIIGAGGQADETASYFDGDVIFRAVTSDYISEGLVDVDMPTDEQRQTPVVIAMGSPVLRRQMSERWKGEYTSVISPQAYIDASAQVGEGAIVAPNAVITTNVRIGKHAIVNVGASIQHDTVVGDFLTAGPGSRVGGKVTMGDGVFIGIGATVKNSVRIANGVVVGAGAVVINDLDTENGVYVGMPAKCVKVNEGWLHDI